MIRSDGLDAYGKVAGQTFDINAYNQAETIHFANGDILRVTYDASGNPETIATSDDPEAPFLTYIYDGTNRVVAVQDGDAIIGSYVYEETEPDLRVQLDNRTMRVGAGTVRQSASIGNVLSVAYTRPYGSLLGAVRFDDATRTFDLPSDFGLSPPDAVISSSLTRRKLVGVDTGDVEARINFDRPSNVMFLPAEYLTINCATGCVFNGVVVKGNGVPGTLTVPVNSTVNLTATKASGSSCTLLLCDWYVNGLPIFSYGPPVTHTFTTPGSYQVTADCECSPCDVRDAGYLTVNVTPPACNVAFSISPSTPLISATPSMPLISASVTSLTPSNASVSWTASISHTAPGTNCSGGPTFTSNTATGSGTNFTPIFSGLYGGQLAMTATCSASGYTSTFSTQTKTIGGTQPADSSIITQINSQTLPTPMDPADLRRIGCWESAGLNQFTASNTPFYAQNGTAGDVGIMGICYQRTKEHIWSWAENIEYGRTLLVGAGNSRAQAQTWLNSLVSGGATAYGDSRWRDETLKKYNAGTCDLGCAYWNWNATTQQWAVVDNGGSSGYVTSVKGMSATCL